MKNPNLRSILAYSGLIINSVTNCEPLYFKVFLKNYYQNPIFAKNFMFTGMQINQTRNRGFRNLSESGTAKA